MREGSQIQEKLAKFKTLSCTKEAFRLFAIKALKKEQVPGLLDHLDDYLEIEAEEIAKLRKKEAQKAQKNPVQKAQASTSKQPTQRKQPPAEDTSDEEDEESEEEEVEESEEEEDEEDEESRQVEKDGADKDEEWLTALVDLDGEQETLPPQTQNTEKEILPPQTQSETQATTTSPPASKRSLLDATLESGKRIRTEKPRSMGAAATIAALANKK